MAFQSFNFERTQWRLFQKRVVRTKFDINVFIKTIIKTFRIISVLLTSICNYCYISSKAYKAIWLFEIYDLWRIALKLYTQGKYTYHSLSTWLNYMGKKVCIINIRYNYIWWACNWTWWTNISSLFFWPSKVHMNNNEVFNVF